MVSVCEYTLEIWFAKLLLSLHLYLQGACSQRGATFVGPCPRSDVSGVCGERRLRFAVAEPHASRRRAPSAPFLPWIAPQWAPRYSAWAPSGHILVSTTMSRPSRRATTNTADAWEKLPAGVKVGLMRLVTDNQATVRAMLSTGPAADSTPEKLCELCAGVMRQQKLTPSGFLARFFDKDLLATQAELLGKSPKGTRCCACPGELIPL